MRPRRRCRSRSTSRIRRVGSRSGILLTFSHDEKLVAYLSDEGGRTDVWVQPIAGGPGKQITHVKGFVQGLAFSPTADVLAFTTDTGGDELPHLFLTDSAGAFAEGPHRRLAARPPRRLRRVGRRRQDLPLPVERARRAQPRPLRVRRRRPASRRCSGRAKATSPSRNTSRDHRRFIIGETVTDADSNMYLVERGSKAKPVLLTPHKGEVLYGPADLSKDGKTLYYTSDENREFAALYAMNLGTKASKPVAQPDWDVDRRRLHARLEILLHRHQRRRTAAARPQGREDAEGGLAARPAARRRLGPARLVEERPLPRRAPAERHRARDAVRHRHDERRRAQGHRPAARVAAQPRDDRRRDRPHPVVRRKAGAGVPLQADRRRPVPGGHRRARRPHRAVDARVRRLPPVPRVEGLRRPGAERPRLDRLRQDVHAARQPRPRRRAAQGRRRLQAVDRRERQRRRAEGRRHGRKLRRLHGARRRDLHAHRVRRATSISSASRI